MHNYDNRGLVLALCQLNRYKHRKDVSHIHVSKTEEARNHPELAGGGSSLVHVPTTFVSCVEDDEPC